MGKHTKWKDCAQLTLWAVLLSQYGAFWTAAQAENVTELKVHGQHVASKPEIRLDRGTNNNFAINISEGESTSTYELQKSTDMVNWTFVQALPSGSGSIEAGPETPSEKAFFRTVATAKIEEGISGATRPLITFKPSVPSGITKATLWYSADGRQTWKSASAKLIKSDPTGEIWGAEIAETFNPGTVLSYTLELLDTAGATHLETGPNGYHTTTITTTGQTDITPPAFDSNPAVVTTGAETLQVPLWATDNADPAPAIHYTTDGSEPTRNSPLYSTPISVVDKGIENDMVIQYFAEDSSENRTQKKTIKVRVFQPDSAASSIKDIRVLSPEWICAVVDPTQEIIDCRWTKYWQAMMAEKAQYEFSPTQAWMWQFSKNFRSLMMEKNYHLPLFAKFNQPSFWKVNGGDPSDLTVWAHSVDGFPGWDVNDAPTFDTMSYSRRADMIYLKMPAGSGALTNGSTVTVTAEDGRSGILTFDDNSTPCWSIKVNQSSYSTTASKKAAYLGMWLPGIGGADFSAFAGQPFHIKRFESGARWDQGQAVGEPVYTGTITLKKSYATQTVPKFSNANLTGENVYELDFSPFSTEGTYCIQIPGLGRSWPFKVSSGGYGPAFYTMMKGLYVQRCGIELKAPFTKWERPACHTETKQGQFLPESNRWYTTSYRNGATNQNLVGFRNAAGTRIGLSQFTLIENSDTNSPVMPGVKGGWHDAADFDRRIYHYNVVYDLLAAAEAFPENFSDSQLNIPESGNGIPDILDEAAYGVDAFKSTQRPDGAVSSWIEQSSHPTPASNLNAALITGQKQMFAAVGDRSSSFAYASAASYLGRLLAPYSPAKSAEYIASAAQAYAWANQPGNALSGLKFPIVTSAKDPGLKGTTISFDEDPKITNTDTTFVNAAFAAANLYMATGEATYLTDWNTSGVGKQYPGYAYMINPSMCMAVGLSTTLPAADVNLFRTTMAAAADKLLTSQESNPYNLLWVGMEDPWFTSMSWGAVHQKARTVAMAYGMTKAAKYKTSLEKAADYFLGCNPPGTSMITGIGSVYPLIIQHVHSLSDGISDPTPGIAPYTFSSDTPMNSFYMGDRGHSSVKSYFTPMALAFIPDRLGRQTIQEAMDKVAKSPDLSDWVSPTGQATRDAVSANLPVLRRKVPHPTYNTVQNEFTVSETSGPLALLFGCLTAPNWTPDTALLERGPKMSISELPFYPMP